MIPLCFPFLFLSYLGLALRLSSHTPLVAHNLRRACAFYYGIDFYHNKNINKLA